MSKACGTRTILLVAALAAACSKKADEGKKDKQPAKTPPAAAATPDAAAAPAQTPPAQPPAEAPQTVSLDPLGYEITVPGSWTMKAINKETYTFRIPKPPSTGPGPVTPPRLDVVRTKSGPKNLDAGTKGCPGKIIDKKTMADGRFYYVCELTAAGRTLRNFQMITKEKSGQLVACVGNADDVTELLAACETLHKK